MKDFLLQARNLYGINLTPSQQLAFEVYERELLEWNQKINLTAIRDVHGIRVKHFLDSLACLPVMREGPLERVIDVGTGAGLPGFPIKFVQPNVHLTLIESVGKKAAFCLHVAKKLRLEATEVLIDRAESVGQMKSHRQSYDWAVARAVAVLPVLVEYLLPLVRVGGAVIAMKGESAPAEVHDAEYALRILGGQVRKLIPVMLPGVAEERYLVVIDKVAATPEIYPRRVGIPAKKPLLRSP